MNPYAIYLVVCLVSGAVCYFGAKHKGRNPWLWFGIGFIASVIGIGIVTMIKNRRA